MSEQLPSQPIDVCGYCGRAEGHSPCCSVTKFGAPELREPDDSIDYALGFSRMTEALLDYWMRQESMPPEQAIRKLVSEHEVMLDVLRDMGGEVDAMEPYSAWAARVVEDIR